MIVLKVLLAQRIALSEFDIPFCDTAGLWPLEHEIRFICLLVYSNKIAYGAKQTTSGYSYYNGLFIYEDKMKEIEFSTYATECYEKFNRKYFQKSSLIYSLKSSGRLVTEDRPTG